MLEVLICCLSLYIDYLGTGEASTTQVIILVKLVNRPPALTCDLQDVYQPSMVPLGEMVIIALTELLCGSSQNAAVFRELGGASLTSRLIQHADTRESGLGLLQQLVLAAGPGKDIHRIPGGSLSPTRVPNAQAWTTT